MQKSKWFSSIKALSKPGGNLDILQKKDERMKCVFFLTAYSRARFILTGYTSAAPPVAVATTTYVSPLQSPQFRIFSFVRFFLFKITLSF